MGSNLAKLDQARPNRAKHMPKRVKQGQMILNRLKWGITEANRARQGQTVPKKVKWDQIWSNWSKTGLDWFKRGQTEPNGAKCQKGAKGGQTRPNMAKRS